MSAIGSHRAVEGCGGGLCGGDGQHRNSIVSVRVLHFSQLLTGFPAFHAHGSNSPRRLIGYPSTIRVSTSHK